jgi:hypothetical protein
VRPAALAAVLALAGCGYAFSQRYVARGGGTAVHAGTFENLSPEPELGAAVTEALRTELARRGADAGPGAAVAIEGDVRAEPSAPTSPEGGTWRIAVVVRARLVASGAPLAEHAARREADYVGGGDPLETEGRRALALRRLAAEAAREILLAFEE